MKRSEPIPLKFFIDFLVGQVAKKRRLFFKRRLTIIQESKVDLHEECDPREENTPNERY